MLGITTTDRAQSLADEEILVRSQAQPWLFAVLVERYQEAFLRKARSIIRREEDAEEIVQDTFMKIYINAHTFTPQEGAKFTSWAYRILLNTAFTRYQKRVKEGKRVVNLDPDFEQLLGAETNHSGFAVKRDGIDRVLERLPEHFSFVLRRHYLERWSHKDIAKETGETVGTIKARIHRAKAAFRQEAGGEAEPLF